MSFAGFDFGISDGGCARYSFVVQYEDQEQSRLYVCGAVRLLFEFLRRN